MTISATTSRDLAVVCCLALALVASCATDQNQLGGGGQSSGGGCSPNIMGGISGYVDIHCAGAENQRPAARLAQSFNKYCQAILRSNQLQEAPDSFIDQGLGSTQPRIYMVNAFICQTYLQYILSKFKPAQFGGLIILFDGMNERLAAAPNRPLSTEDQNRVAAEKLPEITAAIDSRDVDSFSDHLDEVQACIDRECNIEPTARGLASWIEAAQQAGRIIYIGAGKIVDRSAPPGSSRDGLYDASFVVQVGDRQYAVQQRNFWRKKIDEDCFAVNQQVDLFVRQDNGFPFAVPVDLGKFVGDVLANGYLVFHAPLAE